MMFVDDMTRLKWSFFGKTCDGLGEAAEKFFSQLKKAKVNLSDVIIHCDNGGENIGPLKQVAKKAGIEYFELTPHRSHQ